MDIPTKHINDEVISSSSGNYFRYDMENPLVIDDYSVYCGQVNC